MFRDALPDMLLQADALPESDCFYAGALGGVEKNHHPLKTGHQIVLVMKPGRTDFPCIHTLRTGFCQHRVKDAAEFGIADLCIHIALQIV